MTTQELHIKLDIELQKISSNWNKNFLPQEKDIALNKEITKFVKQRSNPLSNDKRLSTFDTLKRVQDLNVLFKTVPLTVIPINQKEVGVQLPFDFLNYISSEVQVENICKGKVIPTVPKIFYNKTFKPLTATNTITTCLLSLITTSGSYVLFSHSTLPAAYLPQDGIDNYKKDFIYNNAILSLSRRNIPKHFEIRFNNATQLFEVKSELSFTLSLVVNGVISVITSNDITVSVPSSTKSLSGNLIIKDEEFKTLANGSTLSSTKGKNINGYLRSDLILIPITDSVLVKQVQLTYIRKPLNVDLLLNCNSDLSDEVLDEIIGNTTESLKAILSSDTYEKYKDNNTLIE
jgi:hypothetical protein